MRLTIQRRLLLAFLALAVVPLLLAGLTNGALFYRQHAETELVHLQELSLRVANEVDQALGQGEEALRTVLLYRNFARLSASEQEVLLTELLTRNTFFREVAVVDATGHERARRSAFEVVLPRDLRDLRSDERFLQPVATGRVYYGPIHYDPNGEPLLTLAVPVIEFDSGRVAAVLTAEIRIKSLWDLMARLVPEEGAEVYVVDERGMVVAHRNPSVVLRDTRIGFSPHRGITTDGLTGGRAFVAASIVPAGPRVFTVIAEHSWRYAIAPALGSLVVLAGILLLALVFASAAGGYVLRRIVRPIIDVEKTARAIAAGELDRRVVIDSEDEVGELGRSFNAMTDHLRHTLGALQAEVEIRQKTEQALRESESRFRLLVENQNDLVIKIDTDGRLLFVSPSYSRTFGKRAEDLIGHHFMPFVHEEDRARVEASLQRVLTPPYTSGHEERALTVAGWRWLSWSSRAVRDEDGAVQAITAVGRDVTERKEVEEALRTANQYNRSLIEASLDPLVTISADGNITDVNEATVKITGVSRERLIGTDFSNYFTEPDRARSGYREAFEKGFVTDFPLTIQHQNGRLSDVLYNGSVYRDEQGTVRGVFAAARDVTESKRLLHEFVETRNFLDNILQSSTKYSIIGEDFDRRILSWNEGARRNYGYSAEEVVGKDSSILHTAEDLTSGAVDRLLADACANGIAEGEFQRVRKDGSRFWASVVVTRRNDAFGRPIGYLIMSSDISTRKDAEERLRYASVYARSLIEASLDPLVTIGPDGRITDVNAATEAVVGWPREVLIGTDFSDYFTEPQKARAGYETVFREGSVRDYPLEVRHRDGHLTAVLYNASLYRDEAGKVIGVFAAARDVTARKLAEEALQESNEKLTKALEDLRATQQQVIQSEKLAALGTLAAGVAHELNNPLMGIMGYVTFAQEAAQEAEVRQFLEKASRELERIRDLIKNMLGFARPVVEGKLSEVSIPVALERAVALMRPEFKVRNITVAMDVEEGLPPVLAKADHLQQVFLNLLMNARDAVENHLRSEIHIAAQRADTRAVVTVTDTGSGIPPALQGRIFDPFFTTKEPGKGTGLGLSVARNIMADLGGSLTAESREGEGATFTVELPLARDRIDEKAP